jgi:D-glycero-alpha-D-manno-heptose-7-phosphate kinase
MLKPVLRTRAKAPLRLGFAGGGTDLSPYCDQYGGAVLNITVDRYAYAFVTPRNDGVVSFESLDLSDAETYSAADFPVQPRRLLLHHGVHRRIVEQFLDGRPLSLHVLTSVDVPAGSGLGASSALVVALVDAYRSLLDLPLGQYDVARLAYEIERHDLGLAGGRQDQYAAAFGGANFIEFLQDDRVIVNPLRVAAGALEELEASLVLCFTGKSRSSHDIIVQQTASMAAGPSSESNIDAMHRLKHDAVEMKSALLLGDIRRMAELMADSWAAKKTTAAGISNAQIERLHAEALKAGALAGKVSGAGGGGFMMFLAPPELRSKIIARLNEMDGDADVVALTTKGSITWKSPA